MAAVQDATLVSNAFKMALARRCPQTGLVVHSDRGNTYTSNSYLTLLQQNNIQVSMSRTANCYDNAVTVSFFHSLKGECLDQESFQTRTQARQSTFDYIETFYNRIRRHSTLHYLSPVEFEDRWDAPRILPLYETGGRSDRLLWRRDRAGMWIWRVTEINERLPAATDDEGNVSIAPTIFPPECPRGRPVQ
jgi:hypothetical protein